MSYVLNSYLLTYLLNVGFRTVVQLFAPHTNPATHLAQKIPFINS